jgi:cardiolipin synthase A/B
MRRAASLPGLCACALVAACGSSSSQQAGGGDGGSSGSDGAASGMDGSMSGTDGAISLPGPDGGNTIVPSTDIVITVEPDGSGDAQGLLTAIQNAKAAVHMEMYLLSNSTYINALVSLHQKGIDVKVVLNETFPSGTSSSDTNASSYATLQSAGVGVHWAPTTTGFDSYTHEKAVIIDPGASAGQVWIMTMNLDTDAPKYNREYLAQDTGAADITEAEDIFEADYASTSITPSGDLIVAPSPQNNAQPALLALINSATMSIDVEAEEYDSSGIEAAVATALVTKAKAGVTVHVVLEDSTDSEQSTAVSALQAAGGKVVGYAYSDTGLDIHAKAIVVDGARAYVGSENLSGGSLGYNRELGVYFTDPTQVGKVATTIASDFSGGSTYN